MTLAFTNMTLQRSNMLKLKRSSSARKRAKVGMEIKICGNNAGEHGSILGSTLSRLDRPAPYHTDFNTFYIQAASGTTAGSSGSPVLDILGRAVALNVGGSTSSASSFYLPLDQVVRALKLLQEGKPVPRGTLQTEFIHVSYDELKKLGLPDEIERETRQRNEHSNGLLTVSAVLPEGPGSRASDGRYRGEVSPPCIWQSICRELYLAMGNY